MSKSLPLDAIKKISRKVVRQEPDYEELQTAKDNISQLNEQLERLELGTEGASSSFQNQIENQFEIELDVQDNLANISNLVSDDQFRIERDVQDNLLDIYIEKDVQEELYQEVDNRIRDRIFAINKILSLIRFS